MPEEITARIIIEEAMGGSSNAGASAGPKQRERDQTQKDISKSLKGVAGFFGGGEASILAAGIGKLASVFGVGGSLFLALLGLATTAALPTASKVVEGIVTNVTQEEAENMSNLNKELEDGAVTTETYSKVIKDTTENVDDMGQATKDAWENIKDGDWDGLADNIGKTSGAFAEAFRALSKLTKVKDDNLVGNYTGDRFVGPPAPTNIQSSQITRQFGDADFVGPPPPPQRLSTELSSSPLPFISKNTGDKSSFFSIFSR